MARDCSTRKVSSSYQQLNRKRIYKVKTARLSVESAVDTLHLKVMRPTKDNSNVIIPMSQKILNAVEITINGDKAHALMDLCTINGNLISANLCFRKKIPTDGMDAKPLETAIQGSRSTMKKKATVELNIQQNKISRRLYVSNRGDWDAILGQPFLAAPNVIMDVRNNIVSIQSTGKPRQHLHILQKQSDAGSTAGCSIYDCDDDICIDQSSHGPETDIEHEEAEFAKYCDESAAQI